MYYSIGLMSGTSMDGIDAALLFTDGEGNIVELGNIKIDYTPESKRLLKGAERAAKAANGDLQKATAEYPRILREYLIQDLGLDPSAVEAEVVRLTAYLQTANQTHRRLNLADVIQHSTRLHALAVQQMLNASGKSPSEIDFVGYHGQTVFHKPSERITVQLGDGALLAKLTGITVVNDFRSRDVAAGGQGAPLAPLYHRALAKRDGKIPLAVVNCGGIANISLITSHSLDRLIGFDTGPGNGLIDALIKKRTGGVESMDTDGQYGSAGVVNEACLEALFQRAIIKDGGNYFEKKPPKSLDIRDTMPLKELEALFSECGVSSLADMCATLEAFTAESIIRSLNLLDLPVDEIPQHWVLAGGGWDNPVIKSQLEARLKVRVGDDVVVATADEAGWNSAAMEAQIFAYFAVRAVMGLPLSVPGTTRVPFPMTGGHAWVSPEGPTPLVSALFAQNPAVLHGYRLPPLIVDSLSPMPSSDVLTVRQAVGSSHQLSGLTDFFRRGLFPHDFSNVMPGDVTHMLYAAVLLYCSRAETPLSEGALVSRDQGFWNWLSRYVQQLQRAARREAPIRSSVRVEEVVETAGAGFVLGGSK